MGLPKPNLKIASIELVSGEFLIGKKMKFKVVVENIGQDTSSSYTVAVYDENNKCLDTDSEKPLAPNSKNSAKLYLTMQTLGNHTLRFVIEGGESTHNEKYRTYLWSQVEDLNLEIKGIRDTGIESYYRERMIGKDNRNHEYGIGLKVDFGHLLQSQNILIRKAFLKLNADSRSIGAKDKDIGIYRITNPNGWNKVSSSYFNESQCDAQGYLDDKSPWTVDINITDLVKKWYTGKYENYGMYVFAKDNIPTKKDYGFGYYNFKKDNNIKIVVTYSILSENFIGGKDYINIIEQVEAQFGAKAALYKMMHDFNSHDNDIIDYLKYNLSVNFDAFCNKFNELIKQSGLIREEIIHEGPGPNGGPVKKIIIEDDFKEFHYFRNKLNKAPATLEDLMKEKDQWEMLPYYKAAFHMFDTVESKNGLFNLKFVSIQDQRHEAVYNQFGTILTENNDYRNMGTYNYVGPNDIEGHKLYDVEPYYKWGNINGKGEGNSFVAALNRAWDFVQDSSAIEYYNSYATQFKLPPCDGKSLEELESVMKDFFLT